MNYDKEKATDYTDKTKPPNFHPDSTLNPLSNLLRGEAKQCDVAVRRFHAVILLPHWSSLLTVIPRFNRWMETERVSQGSEDGILITLCLSAFFTLYPL